MTAEPSGRRFSTAVAAMGAVLVAVMAAFGFGAGSGPASDGLGRTGTVLLVSVPGLRWQDLSATGTPRLDALMPARGLLSVRAIGPRTTAVEGLLTLGAGNRIEAPDDAAALVDGRCIPGVLDPAARSADDESNGAEAGALGERLRSLGVVTTVHGSPRAIGALMGADGCVDRFVPAALAPPLAPPVDPSVDPSAAPPVDPSVEPSWPSEVGDGVTLVEFSGLETTEVAADRARTIAAIEERLAAMVVPDDALVIVIAPMAPLGDPEVTVAAVRPPRGTAEVGAELVSATTRRAGYVTLPDVAPAVLAALGDDPADLPPSMNGTAVRTTPDGGSPDAATHVDRLADLAERVLMRDRAVGPVSVLLVVLMALCGGAALAGRARAARTLAPIVIGYPTVTFLWGLVAFHQLPLTFTVVVTPLVSAVLASVAVNAFHRIGRWAPVGALAAVLWAVLVADVVTGGHLQINTPLGYSPTVAGRFQGFGNLSFGLVAAASVVTAVLALQHLTERTRAVGPDGPGDREPGSRRVAVAVAAVVGAVTAVAVAAPGFGSDVGGTLAIVPTFVVVVALVAGRRIGWRRAVATAAATVAVVGVLAAIDLARPAQSRTHLGRFLDDLLNGDGGLVLRRKLNGNLSILTSSFWSFVLIAAAALGAFAAWRRRDRVRAAVAQRPALGVFLAGFAVVAGLGFALNDSGLAVPAIMLAVAVPWLVASEVEVVRREPR